MTNRTSRLAVNIGQVRKVDGPKLFCKLRWEPLEVLLDRWDKPEDGYYSVKSSSAVNKVPAWRAQRSGLNRTLWDMKRFFSEFPILQTASVELGVGREQLQPAPRTSQSSACLVLLVC